MKKNIAFIVIIVFFAAVWHSNKATLIPDSEISHLIESADLSNAKVAFNQECGHCHSLFPKDHGIGPSLSGILDTEAGQVAGFSAYSKTINKSQIIWSKYELFKFIKSGRSYTSDINMAFEGVTSDQKTAEIVSLLIDKLK